MKLTSNEVVYPHFFQGDNPKTVVLAADIGGTNSNFGFCELDGNSIKLLVSLHVKSKEIIEFALVVSDILAYAKNNFNLSPTISCFGAAGVVSAKNDSAKPTNLDFVIDAHSIKKITDLQTVVIINDFQAVGCGLEYIDPQKLVEIHKGSHHNNRNKVCLGAGTGLGKSLLLWDKEKKRYLPLPSEGGHADFAAQSQQDLDLLTFIQQEEKIGCPISWEDILSGYGIQRIYKYLSSLSIYPANEFDREIEETLFPPDSISHYRTKSERCKKTFDIYSGYYARCAKNFALDTLAFSGVYIAGGIAAKNIEIFKQDCFIKEFTNCGKLAHLLKDIPIYIVADYNVSLYGAAAFLMHQ